MGEVEGDCVEDAGELRTSAVHREVLVGLVTGAPRKLIGSLVEGWVVFEGDILLGRDDETYGLTRAGERYRWPERTVVYHMEGDLAAPERIAEAIDHWTRSTVIRFRRRTTERDYVLFRNGTGCSSSVGMLGGVQFITLHPRCSVGNIIHEIGHTVGLWHEQSRDDRDQHIAMQWDNIHPAYRHNFEQHISDGDKVGDYDFGSIMHYSENAFAIDRTKTTIVTKDGSAIGQRVALSQGDIDAVAAMYPPPTPAVPGAARK